MLFLESVLCSVVAFKIIFGITLHPARRHLWHLLFPFPCHTTVVSIPTQYVDIQTIVKTSFLSYDFEVSSFDSCLTTCFTCTVKLNQRCSCTILYCTISAAFEPVSPVQTSVSVPIHMACHSAVYSCAQSTGITRRVTGFLQCFSKGNKNPFQVYYLLF